MVLRWEAIRCLQKCRISVLFYLTRTRVSNDNPYSGPLFKTVKYCPQWPRTGFKDLDEARLWVDNFTRWYSAEHKHSGIKYVTPDERYKSMVLDILHRREVVYQEAQCKHPERWSKQSRNWDFIDEVKLNPDKEAD